MSEESKIYVVPTQEQWAELKEIENNYRQDALAADMRSERRWLDEREAAVKRFAISEASAQKHREIAQRSFDEQLKLNERIAIALERIAAMLEGVES